MYKILILALREYRSSVRTKGFIIGLVVFPLLMGGGFFAWSMFGDKVDITPKKIVIIDHTSQIYPAIKKAAEEYNTKSLYDTATNKQVKPKYIIEEVKPDTVNPFEQKLSLSERVSSKEIHAFVIIGADVINPRGDSEKASIKYYSENSFMDDIRGWMNWPLNDKIRKLRIAEMGLEGEKVNNLFHWIDVKGMGLVEASEGGEDIQEAKESNPAEAILIPYVLMMLMFMMIMMSAVPLLYSVMEEKTERIAEVLLGSITPFQFMMGKVIGGISVALTGAAVYIIGGVFVASQMGYADLIPTHVIPWFLTYMVLAMIMIGSIMASLGSASNDNKDAQSLQFPAIIPLIIPMMVIMPVLKDPLSSFSTTMSLIPPFTPFLMLIRQASPATIPAWQPFVGLVGILLFTLLSVWAGGKLFRTMILMQGKRPKFGTILKQLMKK